MATSIRKTRNSPPLRTVREARGLSLREVARQAEIDAGHLSRAERSEARLSLDALARVAKVLGLRELSSFLEPYTKGGGGP
jgi:transcriptional regulator with XRE-family HTH domain